MTSDNPFSDPSFGSNLASAPVGTATPTIATSASTPPTDSNGEAIPSGDILVRRKAPGPAPAADDNPFSDPKFGMMQDQTVSQTKNTAAPPSPSPNGILSNAPDHSDSWTTGLAKGIGTAAVQGVSGAGGMFGSLQDLTNELGDRVYSWTSGLPIEQARLWAAQLRADAQKNAIIPGLSNAIPSGASIENKIASVTGAYQPTTEVGRLAQSGLGAAISGALMNPEAAVAGVIPNVAGGAAAQGAYDVTGDPLLATAAGLVGGAAGSRVGIGDTLATKFSPAARQAKAGDVILNAAQDPTTLKTSLESLPPPNVPNENLTTYQAVGDEGIGQLEREVRAAAPAAFTQRAIQQSEAQTAAMGAIQSGAAPEDVGNYFTTQARALNDQWQDAHEQAMQEAQNQAAGLGAGQSPQSAGQAISNELTPQYQDVVNAAKSQVGALGGDERPDIYGGSMRLQARAAADDAQQRLSALYDAVPDDVTTSIAPLKQTAQGIYGNMEPAVKATVSPVESAIVDTLGQYPDAIPFQSARAIDTLITSSMRNELKSAGFATPAYVRMVQLKGAWEKAMSGSVAERAAQDDAAVAAGTMAPENTLGATLAREGQAHVSAARAQNAATGSGGSYSNPPSGGEVGFPLQNGSQVQAVRGPGNGPRPQAVSGQALPDAITQAGLDALSTAKSAAKDFAATYKSGPVGDVLRKAGTSGSYKMPDYAVPDAVFPKGPKGFAAVQAYRNAVGNDPEAISALHNYAAATLRKAAVNEDGVIDPKAYAKWRGNYGEALRGVPEIAPQFDTAAHAADALQQFGKFSPKYAPTNVPELFFAPGPAGAAGVDHLRSLVGRARANPIMADYATALMRGAAEKSGVIDPVALQKWNEKYAPAMSRYPGLTAKFADAGKATEAIGQVAANRKQAVADYEKGVAGKLIGVNDPTTVQRHVGSIFGRADAVPLMRDLVARAKQDPSGLAMQGVRQAIVDHIASQFLSANKIGASDVAGFKPGQFSKFMRANEPVLAEAFPPADMADWGNIVRSVEATNRSIAGSKLPGGSNTPQDILKALKAASEKGEHDTIFGRLWKAAIVSREFLEPGLEQVGMGHLAMPLSLVGAVGSNVVAGMRNAGMAKVADMVKEGLLNPELAKTYVMRASQVRNRGSEMALAAQLRRLSALGPITSQAPAPQYHNGGRVAGPVDRRPLPPMRPAGEASQLAQRLMALHGHPRALASKAKP